MKSFLTYLILSLTLCANAQSNWENFSVSAGYGYNLVTYSRYVSYDNSSQSNPCDRCSFEGYRKFSREFFAIPIRIGHQTKFINYDITFSSASFKKFYRQYPNHSYSKLQTNVGFDILELIRNEVKPEVSIGVNYSFVYSTRLNPGTNNYLGPSITLGIKKLKLRCSAAPLLDKNVQLFSQNDTELKSYFWTFDLMYSIYPFRKREKTKE